MKSSRIYSSFEWFSRFLHWLDPMTSAWKNFDKVSEAIQWKKVKSNFFSVSPMQTINCWSESKVVVYKVCQLWMNRRSLQKITFDLTLSNHIYFVLLHIWIRKHRPRHWFTPVGILNRQIVKIEFIFMSFTIIYLCMYTEFQAGGGSEPTLNCRSHHKEGSDLQGRDSMSQGKLLGGFWVILRDLFVLILEDSQNPQKGGSIN